MGASDDEMAVLQQLGEATQLSLHVAHVNIFVVEITSPVHLLTKFVLIDVISVHLIFRVSKSRRYLLNR